MRTATRSRWHRRYRRHHLTAAPTDLGFGYSRESDATDRPEPVLAGIEMHFFTGRATRRPA
jgi:hypothetical protein